MAITVNTGIIGTLVERTTPSIVQGADSRLVVQISYAISKEPFVFNSFVSANAYFKKTDGTILTVAGAVVALKPGQLAIALSQANSALLKVGSDLDFEVDVTDADGLKKIILTASLSVVAPIFPAAS